MTHIHTAIKDLDDHLRCHDSKDWDSYWQITNLDPDGVCQGSSFVNFPLISGVCCTGYALEIYRRLKKRTSIYGFFEEDNPESEIAKTAGGHDFAVIDHRYIVDPWATGIECLYEPTALDIRSKRHKTIVEKFYGPVSRWDRLSESGLRELITSSGGTM